MNLTIPSLLHLFLRKLHMRIDLVRIREAYAGHPLPHSIRALSDTLDELHVPNMVCRLEFGQLFEIGGPFVIKVGEEEFPFFLVESLDRERKVIVLCSTAGRRIEIPFDNFRILWDGTTLLAEKCKEMNDPPRTGILNQAGTGISRQHVGLLAGWTECRVAVGHRAAFARHGGFPIFNKSGGYRRFAHSHCQGIVRPAPRTKVLSSWETFGLQYGFPFGRSQTFRMDFARRIVVSLFRSIACMGRIRCNESRGGIPRA